MHRRIPCPSHRTPYDDDDGVSKLQDQVFELLENAHVPQPTIDDVLRLIWCAEQAWARSTDPTPTGD